MIIPRSVDMNSWSPPDNLMSGEMLVVACSTHFFHSDFVQDVTLPEAWNLDIKCHFSNDVSLISDADALWFHGPSIRSFPKKIPGQKWIVMSMESEEACPFLKEKKAMDLFDIHMTYKLSSDVPTLYPSWHEYGSFMRPPAANKNKNSLALFAASNAVPYRNEYVSELMTHINVDSVGKCLNNKIIPGFTNNSDSRLKTEYNRKIDISSIIQNYKFYLAFENAHSKDYVTEKVFQTLAVGTVPVYSGAENILDFMPDENAIININDFSNPKELADYLIYLDHDDDEYQKHLAWKTTGYSPNFKRLVDIASINPLQRMFIKLAHGCGHECRCGGKSR